MIRFLGERERMRDGALSLPECVFENWGLKMDSFSRFIMVIMWTHIKGVAFYDPEINAHIDEY